jgi:hypothetical protein
MIGPALVGASPTVFWPENIAEPGVAALYSNAACERQQNPMPRHNAQESAF